MIFDNCLAQTTSSRIYFLFFRLFFNTHKKQTHKQKLVKIAVTSPRLRNITQRRANPRRWRDVNLYERQNDCSTKDRQSVVLEPKLSNGATQGRADGKNIELVSDRLALEPK